MFRIFTLIIVNLSIYIYVTCIFFICFFVFIMYLYVLLIKRIKKRMNFCFVVVPGVAQCAELSWQLRGLADKRQVPGAELGLQHNIGLGGAVVCALYRMGFSKA